MVTSNKLIKKKKKLTQTGVFVQFTFGQKIYSNNQVKNKKKQQFFIIIIRNNLLNFYFIIIVYTLILNYN